MPLVLYNTLSKKEEEFVPLQKGKVTMYTCGPTVYSRPHIGNYASFLMADLLRRWLEAGHRYFVQHVKNVTDVGHLLHDVDHGDDKIQREAEREHVHPLDIALRYVGQYLADEQSLAMREPEYRPRATETIDEMIAMITRLTERGHAYETEDGVYFEVSTFPQYGALSGNTISGLSAGARVDVDEQKKHPADFALWKKCVGPHASHILRWPSPWGEGFPGWHIECSAMSTKFLGAQIDIHTGGEDNIFPHHECEIAQSECASGKKPFVKVWLHRRRIDIGGDKMSKSLGNVLNLDDIIRMGYSPLDLRYYLLSVHYRTNLKFTGKGLEDARKARNKIMEWMAEIRNACMVIDGMSETELKKLKNSLSPDQRAHAEVLGNWKDHFAVRMNEDLNTPGALGVVFNATTTSRLRGTTDYARSVLGDFVDLIQQTFGCFPEEHGEIPKDIQALIDGREVARAEGDFERADRLRLEIRTKGFAVRDTATGPDVRKCKF